MPSTKRFPLLLLAAALAAALGGCASTAQRAGAQAGPAAAQAWNYVDPAQFRDLAFPPPPVPGSPAQKADFAVVMDWQRKRTSADCERADSAFFESYELFWADGLFLGGASSGAPAGLKELFARIDADAAAAVDLMKERFGRPRPSADSPLVEPCVKKSGSASYPSGHAAFARIFALALADLMPARREEFLKKADEIARDRVVGGAHYPADTAAGKLLGDEFHARLRKSPAYLRDAEALRPGLK